MLLFCPLLLSSSSLAQIAPQYSISEWKHQDGLPSTRIYAIQQTPDGFLWLGTADGLVRFDGLQFTQESLTTDGRHPLGRVVALKSSSETGLIVATEKGKILRVGHGPLAVTGLSGRVITLSLGKDHQILVTTSTGRWELSPTDLRVLSHSNQTTVESICPSITSFVTACVRDHQGNEWIGTHTQGLLLHSASGETRRFDQGNGLTSADVSAIFEDREANIWVGTTDGLNRLRKDRFRTISFAGKALPYALFTSGEAVWAQSEMGFARLDRSHPSTIHFPVAVQAVTGDGHTGLFGISHAQLLTMDQTGSILQRLPLPATDVTQIIRTQDGGLLLLSPSRGVISFDPRARAAAPATPLPAGCVASIMRSAGSYAWIACVDGSILRLRDHVWTRFTLPSSNSEPINQMLPESDGSIWFATDVGLLFYDSSRFHHWDKQSGIPGSRVQWVREDAHARLWLGYSMGVAEVDRASLLASKPEVHLFDDADGILGTPEARSSEVVAQAPDGSLWLTLSGGVAHLDVNAIHLNPVPPPVHIVSVASNGHELQIQRTFRLPHQTRLIEIGFSAPSLVDARKIRFRYRLEGFNETWQETHNVRRVSYANLKPGSYRFHVTACNNDGVWNDVGDVVTIIIRPAWYQTRMFLVVAVLLVVASIVLVYRLRSAQRQRALLLAMDIRVRERMEIARELHDNLLQDILAVSLQLELADAAAASQRPVESFVERALTLTRAALKRGRGALTSLRTDTLQWSTFVRDLQRCAEDTDPRTSHRVRIETEGEDRSFSPVAGEQIAFIVREAVRNSLLHTSGPILVSARFRPHRFSISIRDHGAGLNEAQSQGAHEGHYGIRGMRERALRIGADLQLMCHISSGTEWTLAVPASVAYATSTTARRHPLMELLGRWKH